MRFSAQQFAQFALPEQGLWIESAAKRLYSAFDAHYAMLGVTQQDLLPAIQATVAWAQSHDVTGERDVASLCAIVPSLGHRFWLDPRFAGLATGTLDDRQVPRAAAVATVVEQCGQWLQAFWQADTIAAFADRLAYQLSHDVEPSPATLHAVLPNHWLMYDQTFNAQLIDWILRNHPPVMMAAQRFALTAGALMHGTGWHADPQYRHVVQFVLAADVSGQLAERLHALYRGMPE